MAVGSCCVVCSTPIARTHPSPMRTPIHLLTLPLPSVLVDDGFADL